jgi:hypothetical protein
MTIIASMALPRREQIATTMSNLAQYKPQSDWSTKGARVEAAAGERG